MRHSFIALYLALSGTIPAPDLALTAADAFFGRRKIVTGLYTNICTYKIANHTHCAWATSYWQSTCEVQRPVDQLLGKSFRI